MTKSISHFGVHNAESGDAIAVNANAGDTFLFQATRDLFTKCIGDIEWKLEALWEAVDESKVRALNERAAILLGGGGLFLKDQAGADPGTSGWQWNCSKERIQELTKPLIVFGVGYNRFRGQEEFDAAFAEQITSVVEQSSFFGLRNHGSRYALRQYLPVHLHHKVRYQPCPTTVSWRIYPQLVRSTTEGKKMVLNAAFDRREMRFGNDGKEDRLLQDIADVIKRFEMRGWSIILANHKPQDAEIAKHLEKAGVSFQAADLSKSYPEDIVRFYLDADVTIGMRGHAQMIPFGLRRKIVSIISHDKIGWFLDDIAHPEWGVDVEDEAFAEKLETCISDVTSDRAVADKIETAQDMLWRFTESNMEEIKESLS